MGRSCGDAACGFEDNLDDDLVCGGCGKPLAPVATVPALASEPPAIAPDLAPAARPFPVAPSTVPGATALAPAVLGIGAWPGYPAPGPCPIGLWYEGRRVLTPGAHDALRVQVELSGAHPIDGAVLRVRAPKLLGEALVLLDPSPVRQDVLLPEFTVPGPGRYPVRFEIETLPGIGPASGWTRDVLLEVAPPGRGDRAPVINISNASGVAIDMARIAWGGAGGGAATGDEDPWSPVDLMQDPALTRRLEGELLRPAPGAEFVYRDEASGTEHRSPLAEPAKLGRSRKSCRLPAVVLPRTQENDARSEKISREQLELWWRAGRLWARQLSSSAASALDGRPLASVWTALRHGATLMLTGVLAVRVEVTAAAGTVSAVTLRARAMR